MEKTQVRNMTGRTGREVANQFEIRTDKGTYFQSYRTMIVFIPYGDGKTQLDKNSWDASMTTGKYRNQFLGETKAETERKIKDGTYELTDLN
jgi:hypothetical protein